jgi:hypothetical protein
MLGVISMVSLLVIKRGLTSGGIEVQKKLVEIEPGMTARRAVEVSGIVSSDIPFYVNASTERHVDYRPAAAFAGETLEIYCAGTTKSKSRRAVGRDPVAPIRENVRQKPSSHTKKKRQDLRETPLSLPKGYVLVNDPAGLFPRCRVVSLCAVVPECSLVQAVRFPRPDGPACAPGMALCLQFRV